MDDRKSTIGYCVYLGNNIIFWNSQKQKVVSRSSTEIEYRSIAAVLSEIIWISSLLHELRLPSIVPTIHSDNLGVVLLAANPITHSRSKHFELDLHFLRDRVQQHQTHLVHLPGIFEVVDILTKPLSTISFIKFRHKLKVECNPIISLRGNVSK